MSDGNRWRPSTSSRLRTSFVLHLGDHKLPIQDDQPAEEDRADHDGTMTRRRLTPLASMAVSSLVWFIMASVKAAEATMMIPPAR